MEKAKDTFDSFRRALLFKERLCEGVVSLGAGVSFNDPTVTEALCQGIDFVWFDMEHNPLTLEHIQNHVIVFPTSSNYKPLLTIIY